MEVVLTKNLPGKHKRTLRNRGFLFPNLIKNLQLERIFKKIKGMIVVHKNYTGVVCGYTPEKILLAVEGCEESNHSPFFRTFDEETFILPKYTGKKFLYVYTNENEVLRQNAQSSAYEQVVA